MLAPVGVAPRSDRLVGQSVCESLHCLGRQLHVQRAEEGCPGTDMLLVPRASSSTPLGRGGRFRCTRTK